MLACPTSSCYKTESPQTTLIASRSGKCETTINCHFDDGIVAQAYRYRLLTNNIPDLDYDAVHLALYNEFYASIKDMRSSALGCIKNAIAQVYEATILHIQPVADNVQVYDLITGTNVNFNDVVLIPWKNQLVCWIKAQRAFEGPCADVVDSIVSAWKGIVLYPATAWRSFPNNPAAGTFVPWKQIVQHSIDSHNCCKMKPLVLSPDPDNVWGKEEL